MQNSDDLNSNISKLTAVINKQISFKRSFFLALVQGVGTAIGATLVAGIVVALIYQFILSVDNIPLIQKLIPPSYIENIVKSAK